jgi:Flp pilus assembly pilin Flp
MPRLIWGVRDDEAATFVEYAVLIGLIALVALSAVDLLGSKLNSMFTALSLLLNPPPSSH